MAENAELSQLVKCPACGATMNTVENPTALHVCVDEATFNMRWVSENEKRGGTGVIKEKRDGRKH